MEALPENRVVGPKSKCGFVGLGGPHCVGIDLAGVRNAAGARAVGEKLVKDRYVVVPTFSLNEESCTTMQF